MDRRKFLFGILIGIPTSAKAMSLHNDWRDIVASGNPELIKSAHAILAQDFIAAGLPREWKPRQYQLKAWNYLVNGGKRACLVWHRRSGKDEVALNWACKAAHLRRGEYWHMLPESSQARKAIWDAVNPHTGKRRILAAFPADLIESLNESEMKIRFKNGSLWRVVGSDNYDSLVGSTPAGIVYSEWALADPRARDFLTPILAENDGWEIFVFTPRGTNHAYETYQYLKGIQEKGGDSFAELLTANDTGVFKDWKLQEELERCQNDYGQDDGLAFFEQEYFCSFVASLVGSYYGSYISRAQKENRIISVPIERGCLVHTSWDLGVSDATSIWFIQVVGKEFRLVDYHEGSGVGLDEYARVLQAKQQEHKWIYGIHYFPHDVTVRELNIGGRSRLDTLRSLGITAKVVPQHHINDGINAVRRLLDLSFIDEKRCARGIKCLQNYRRAWNEKLKAFADNPLHDEFSHGADALRYFAAGYKDPKVSIARIPDPKPWGNGPADAGTGWMGRG